MLILLGAVFQALLVLKDWQQVWWVTLLTMGAGFASALEGSKVFHAHTAELPALANDISFNKLITKLFTPRMNLYTGYNIRGF